MDAAAIGEEAPLVLLDAHREVPTDAGAVLPVVAVTRDVGDLGPRANGVRFLPLHLPRGPWEADNLGPELLGEIGADRVLDAVLLALPEDGGLVERAVGPDADPLDALSWDYS